MQLIDQSAVITNLWHPDPLRFIEEAGRTCYKSEDKITPESSKKFVRGLIKRGHHSVIEHVGMTVRFITNRGVTHEMVRHRLASYSQESTRYVEYQGDGAEFIRPVWMTVRLGEYTPGKAYAMRGADYAFILACLQSVEYYRALIDEGWRKEQAREVLNNAVKTEIVVTANMREWRHIFTLRASKKAHPNMRVLMSDCLNQAKQSVPVLFEDLSYEY